MKHLLWFALLFSFQLVAEEESEIPQLFEGVNYLDILGGEPSLIVGGCVNALTGDYVEVETDIVVPGKEELSLKRFYCSSQTGGADPFHAWKFNHDILVKTKKSKKHIYPILNEAFGAQIPFRGKNSHFTLSEKLFEKRITNTGSSEMSGRSNLKNKSIHLTKEGRYYLKDGANGSVHFSGGPDTEKAYVKQVIKPNFNHLSYTYAKNSLESIKALNQTGSLFGQITLSRTDKENKSLLTAISTGQKDVAYHMQKVKSKGKDKWILAQVERACAPSVTYQFDEAFDKIIARHSKDRFLQIKYMADGEYSGRVHTLKAPLGSDKTAIQLYQFHYSPLSTEVCDAHNNRTKYRFGADERLSKIIKFKGKNPYSTEEFFWKKGGDLTSRSLSSATGKVLFCKTYEYDDAGNVLSEFIFGNLTGHNHHPVQLDEKGVPLKNGCEFLYVGREYSKDGCNLITYENHADHEHDLLYEYHPGTTLIRARFTVEGQAIRIREFFDYDSSGAKILEITDNGSNLNRDDLTQVTERRIIKTHNTQSFPLGLPEIIEESYLDLAMGRQILLKTTLHSYDKAGRLCKKTVVDSKGEIAFTETWVYNDRGNVIRETDALGQVIERKFDDQGNKVLEKRPNGVSYRYTYDFMNRLIREEEEGKEGGLLSKSYRYDYKGNLIASSDIFGQETQYVFNELDRETKVIYPDHSCLEKSYDIIGNVSRLMDARGAVTSYKYTLHGKPCHIFFADGSEETSFYSLKGALLKKIHKNGSYTIYSYDYLSRPTCEELFSHNDELLSHIERKYNAFHLLEETDAGGSTTYYTYDGAGRLILTDKEGMKKEYAYDSLGRRHLIKEYFGPESHQCVTTFKQFDVLNRVVSEWIQDTKNKSYKKTTYLYDADGRIVERSSDNKRTLTHYNFHGDPIEEINALGQVTRLCYGYPSQNTIEIIDPMGRRIKNSYDALGRHASEEHFNFLDEIQQRTEYRYDLAGNRTDIIQTLLPTQSQKITRYEFDSMSRPTACIEAAGSALQRREETRYDISGNIRETVKPDGVTMSYQYDAKNRLKTLYSSDNSVHYSYEYDPSDNWITAYDHVHHQLTKRSYDALNHLKSEKLGNGLEVQYRHDYFGRLLNLTLPDSSYIEYVYEGPCLTHVKRVSTTGELIYEHCYSAYSPQLKPLKVDMAGTAGSLEYAYDALERVTQITSKPYEEHISYDPIGNVKKRTSQNAVTNYAYSDSDLDQLLSEAGPSAHTYAYDALNNQIARDDKKFSVNVLNQLTDTIFEYDQRGNCLKEDDITYHYDALDRLTCVETPEQKAVFQYDAENRRLSKSLYTLQGDLLSHERYFYQKNLEIGSCDSQNILQELRVLGLQTTAEVGAAIAFELSGKIFIPLHDSLGNLVRVLDIKEGATLEAFEYSAFTEESNLTSQIPWRFSSKRSDPETGLIFFGHRYYNPSTSRWLTSDPLRFASGLNLYNYCKNNPLRYYDPDGRFVFAIPLLLWGAQGFVLALPTLTQLGCIAGAAVAGYATAAGYRYLSETISEDVPVKAKPRTEPKDLPEQLTLEEAVGGAGKPIMNEKDGNGKSKIKDPKYPPSEWEKKEHIHVRPNSEGGKIIIHYWEKIGTGIRELFKFKD